MAGLDAGAVNGCIRAVDEGLPMLEALVAANSDPSRFDYLLEVMPAQRVGLQSALYLVRSVYAKAKIANTHFGDVASPRDVAQEFAAFLRGEQDSITIWHCTLVPARVSAPSSASRNFSLSPLTPVQVEELAVQTSGGRALFRGHPAGVIWSDLLRWTQSDEMQGMEFALLGTRRVTHRRSGPDSRHDAFDYLHLIGSRQVTVLALLQFMASRQFVAPPRFSFDTGPASATSSSSATGHQLSLGKSDDVEWALVDEVLDRFADCGMLFFLLSSLACTRNPIARLLVARSIADRYLEAPRVSKKVNSCKESSGVNKTVAQARVLLTLLSKQRRFRPAEPDEEMLAATLAVRNDWVHREPTKALSKLWAAYEGFDRFVEVVILMLVHLAETSPRSKNAFSGAD